MEENKTLEVFMRDRIRAQVENLSTLTPGSKEHAASAKDITELYKAVSQELNGEYEYEEFCAKMEADKEKFEFDKAKHEDEQTRFEEELEFKKNQLAFEKEKFEYESSKNEAEIKRQKIEDIWDKVFKGADLAVKVLCVALPLGFYAKWMSAGFEFEQSGTFTSNTFKGLFNKFKPTKVD